MALKLKHSVYDSDTHFSINPITRAIKNESTTKTGLIQYDHNSERFTFEIPKIIEGHDMSQCDVIEVHYINVDTKEEKQSADVYRVTDMQISAEDENIVIFSWLISQNATRYVGSLNFLVRFACTAEDNPAEIVYAWHTAVHSGITVSSGISNSASVLEGYSDVLEQWRAEMNAFRLMKLEQTKKSTVSGGENVWTATFGNGETRTLSVFNGGKGGTGETGKSAYDIAKEKDLTIGTEEEWAKSLKVPQFYNGDTKLNKVTFKLVGTTLEITTS